MDTPVKMPRINVTNIKITVNSEGIGLLHFDNMGISISAQLASVDASGAFSYTLECLNDARGLY